MMKKITSAAAAVQASITQQKQTEEKTAPVPKPKERVSTRTKTKEKKAGGRPKIYDEEMTRVNFKVPTTFLQDLKYLANVEGKSMTQLFLAVFGDAIGQHEKEIKALKKMRGEA